MRFVCDSCRAQYMISDDKVGAKGVKIKCKKCGHMILVRPAGAAASKDTGTPEAPAMESTAAAAPSNGATSSNAAELPASVGTPPSGGLFTGVEEDEIGAVFDQVLNSGSHKIPAGEPLGNDARESKSAPSAAVSKLAETEEQPDEPQAAPPANDWYVAIDDKQVGPLTMEKVKEHWDRGEVGPDSLCWRAGFSDWIPLSEAAELASVLAPRPAKPVIVAPAAVAATVPSAPVESAFSAGAAAKSARPEIPAAPALGAEPTSSGWKPSAASVLASLVKEENDALSKPPPKLAPVEEKPAVGGLLDLPPPEPAQAPAARAAPMLAAVAAEPALRPQPAPMPYAQPAPAYAQPAPAYAQPAPAYAGYPQPAYPGYPPPAVSGPQGGNNKIIMVAGGAVAVAVLVSVVLFLALREPSAPPSTPSSDNPNLAVVTPPPAKAPEAAAAPTTPGTAAAQDGTTPAVAPTPPTSAPAEAANPGTAPGAQPAVATPTQPAPTPPAPPPAAVDPGTTKPPAAGRVEQPAVAKVDRPTSSTPRRPEAVAAPSTKSRPADDGLSSDDEFDKLFDTKKPASKGGSQQKTPDVYVPPAPGGGDRNLPEQLQQSDIMAVVLANKPAIVKCVNDAKKQDPGVSGKLVMRWTIQPSGKTTSVSVQTDEFRKTYMATCMTNLIKGWTFPKHRKQGSPIDFPFTF
jgi:predicted Zn finger-like uncharacterized protein